MGQTSGGRQLGIPGFGVSVAAFARQAETIEVHTPELHVARTAVLDYFTSPQQRGLEKMMHWEKYWANKPGKPLIKYFRNICREIAYPNPTPHFMLRDANPNASMLLYVSGGAD